jgi:hypothetical protein
MRGLYMWRWDHDQCLVAGDTECRCMCTQLDASHVTKCLLLNASRPSQVFELIQSFAKSCKQHSLSQQITDVNGSKQLQGAMLGFSSIAGMIGQVYYAHTTIAVSRTPAIYKKLSAPCLQYKRPEMMLLVHKMQPGLLCHGAICSTPFGILCTGGLVVPC